ncbi:MAG: Mut7-C RNAse domain-containing protein [Candidatus Electryoneaceae bacterium]|nr:Mut7-C RNAse domain-containing protein [Candidatus Electryoneaceae bacterium]
MTNSDDLRFIVGGELGKLAKRLRMLGFDCLYDGGMSLTGAINIAAADGRILLTCRPVAQTQKVKVVRITAVHPNDQLTQVAEIYLLTERMDPFSCCLVCNVRLLEVADISPNEVPPSVIERGLKLRRCPKCQRIYWRGSHTERMEEQMQFL